MSISTSNNFSVAPRDPESTFLRGVAALDESPFFGVPDSVREVIAKYGSSTKLVMLGTKDFGDHLLFLKDRGCEVVGVVDDFRYTQKVLHRGVPVISTDSFLAMSRQDDIVAFNTCRYDYSKRFFDNLCREHGIPHINHEQAVRVFRLQGKVDYRVDDWGKAIVENATRYLALAKRFDDSYSVATLFGVLNFHLTCEPEYCHQIERPPSTLYYRSGLLEFSEKEKMVDCGAAMGESLAGLVGTTRGKFEHSWLIEPDRFNIQTLQKELRRYGGTPLESKITVHGVGAGDVKDQVPFKHMGGHLGRVLSSNDGLEPTDFIDVRPVDDIIDDVPTFIKIDTEGAELPALKGSRKSIIAGKPKMAISAYHRANDLLELTDFVLSVNPEYRLGLRHHSSERWDTCLYFY